MAYLTIQKKIRIGPEQQKMIEELLQMDGQLENESHVFRCAINYFYEWKKLRVKEAKK